MLARRLTVFIDVQNVYMRARGRLWKAPSHHTLGQIDPIETAAEIAGNFTGDIEIAQVRLYRGLPSNHNDPKGYSAVRRQAAAWSKAPEVVLKLRPLQYSMVSQGNQNLLQSREKGIDVALAVDFVSLAMLGEFDIGVIFSMDTDLKPALEVVAQNAPDIQLGVASWKQQLLRNNSDFGIKIPGIELKQIQLGLAEYERIKDLTNYSR